MRSLVRRCSIVFFLVFLLWFYCVVIVFVFFFFDVEGKFVFLIIFEVGIVYKV